MKTYKLTPAVLRTAGDYIFRQIGYEMEKADKEREWIDLYWSQSFPDASDKEYFGRSESADRHAKNVTRLEHAYRHIEKAIECLSKCE